MKFDELYEKVLNKPEKIKISVNDHNQNYTLTKQEFKSKYDVNLVKVNTRGDLKTFQGTRDNIVNMIKELEHLDDYTLYKIYPQLKSYEDEIKEKGIANIISDYEKYYSKDHANVADAIIRKYELGYEEIINWGMKDLKVDSVADKEHISIRNRSSVSSNTLSGEIKILGKKYSVDKVLGNMTVQGI